MVGITSDIFCMPCLWAEQTLWPENPRAKVHTCWHLEVNQTMGRNPKSQEGIGGAPMGNAQTCHYLEHYLGL